MLGVEPLPAPPVDGLEPPPLPPIAPAPAFIAIPAATTNPPLMIDLVPDPGTIAFLAIPENIAAVPSCIKIVPIDDSIPAARFSIKLPEAVAAPSKAPISAPAACSDVIFISTIASLNFKASSSDRFANSDPVWIKAELRSSKAPVDSSITSGSGSN